jgi:hypothetical protein
VPSDCQKQCPTLHRPRHTHTDGRTHTLRQMGILIRSCDGGYDRTTIAGPGPGQKARNERITHGKRTGQSNQSNQKRKNVTVPLFDDVSNPPVPGIVAGKDVTTTETPPEKASTFTFTHTRTAPGTTQCRAAGTGWPLVTSHRAPSLLL